MLEPRLHGKTLTISGDTGFVVSFWLARLVAGQLYGLEPGDAGTRLAATVSLLAVALLAGYLPARRASRIAPATSLRCE